MGTERVTQFCLLIRQATSQTVARAKTTSIKSRKSVVSSILVVLFNYLLGLVRMCGRENGARAKERGIE